MNIIARIQRLAWRIPHRDRLDQLSIDERRELWPPAKPLAAKHISKCRLIENRVSLLNYMPKGSICAELGIWRGDYSEQILRITQPKKLHLIDLAYEAIRNCEERFRTEIKLQIVEVHLGDSAEELAKLPDAPLDWVYVDADNSYEAVRRDLIAILPKLKTNGLIVLNDYTYFSPSSFSKFGVVEAVNEFCLDHDFELIFFALQGRGYNDVVLRRIP